MNKLNTYIAESEEDFKGKLKVAHMSESNSNFMQNWFAEHNKAIIERVVELLKQG